MEVKEKRTSHRGLLLICASKTERHIYAEEANHLPIEYNLRDRSYCGKALAVRELIDCRLMTKEDEKQACYPYKEGLYVWVYSDKIITIPHFEVRGMPGIFNIEHDSLNNLPF